MTPQHASALAHEAHVNAPGTGRGMRDGRTLLDSRDEMLNDHKTGRETAEMSIALRFTNGSEPSSDERRDIANAYARWADATEGGSNDEELDAARELIEQLMRFASIETDEDDTRECDRCGDEVDYLSFRDWCDGCEALRICDECDEEATNFWPNLTKPVQLCNSCEHNARRSGWEPGA